jgi:two-component system OmpR family response regulator
MMNHNLILVAEDDEDIRDMLVSTLRKADFLTVQAKDGNTAARIVTMARPVGIVTDVRMPALNGMELCRLVRSNPELRNTVVLMTSAHTDPCDIETGLRAGADDYLPKPLSPKQMIRNLRHLIHQREEPDPL